MLNYSVWTSSKIFKFKLVALALQIVVFLDTFVKDGNGEGAEYPFSPVRPAIIDVNDVSTPQVPLKHFGEVTSSMSLFQHAGRYSGHLDVCRFLGMLTHGISFITRDGEGQRLTAARD